MERTGHEEKVPPAAAGEPGGEPADHHAGWGHAGARQGAGGPVVPVDGGVPGPRSEEAARLWHAAYGAKPGGGTDYEATRQSTEAIRAAHRVARGPGNPRQQADVDRSGAVGAPAAVARGEVAGPGGRAGVHDEGGEGGDGARGSMG